MKNVLFQIFLSKYPRFSMEILGISIEILGFSFEILDISKICDNRIPYQPVITSTNKRAISGARSVIHGRTAM